MITMNSKKVREKGGRVSSTAGKFDKQPQLKISSNEKEIEMGMIGLHFKDGKNKLLFMVHNIICTHIYTLWKRGCVTRAVFCLNNVVYKLTFTHLVCKNHIIN